MLVGDVNMNRSRQTVRPDGMEFNNAVVPFRELFAGVASLVDGDVNFCNLETTVMDRNDIPRSPKKYNFRSHPEALKLVRQIGFNLFSIANNHLYDYGMKGIEQTLHWLRIVAAEVGDLHFAGAGTSAEEAASPTTFEIKGIRIAFLALSGLTPSRRKGGYVASARYPDEALARLRDCSANLKILSLHAGKEIVSKPDRLQRTLARKAIDEYGVHLVVGHHPHVVQGIEAYHGGLIFYSLGNFVMRGSRSRNPPQTQHLLDFGLLARLDVEFSSGGAVVFRALEVVPITRMHAKAIPFPSGRQIQKRLKALNRLCSREFIGHQTSGLRFRFEVDRGVCENL